MTLNTHVVCTHVVDSVRNFGPTWAYACWSMEDYAGNLVNGTHSFHGMLLQVQNVVGLADAFMYAHKTNVFDYIERVILPVCLSCVSKQT